MGGVSVRFANRRELNAKNRRERESLELKHQQFLAVAETAADAFYILQSVRDAHGEITDFTFRYLNLHASRRFDKKNAGLVGTSYRQLVGSLLSEHRFAQYCEVVSTGTPLTVEFPVSLPESSLTWLRHQVVKLDDGIAITSTDLSEFKAVRDRFQSLSEFSDTIFAHAPFSIIATDAAGNITALNHEAETLTGYTGTELIGSASILQLLDSDELRQRSEELFQEHGVRVEGVDAVAGAHGAREKDHESRAEA